MKKTLAFLGALCALFISATALGGFSDPQMMISPTTNLPLTFNLTGLGTTTSNILSLTNSTAAAAGTQQVSPAIYFRGYGWKTDATASSRAVDFNMYVLPVQGAANPTGNFKIRSRINAGSWSDCVTISSAGSITAAGNVIGGTIAMGSVSAGPNTGTSNQLYSTATTQGIAIISNVADGATATAVKIGAYSNLTTAGAKIVGFYNNSVEKSFVDINGNYSGGFIRRVTPKTTTGPVTAAESGVITCDATAAEVTLTLPDAAGNTGLTYYVKKINVTNACVLDGLDADTIDGAPTATLSGQWSVKGIVSEGTNWIVISSNTL